MSIPLELKGKIDPKKSHIVKFLFNGQEKEMEVPETTSLLDAAGIKMINNVLSFFLCIFQYYVFLRSKNWSHLLSEKLFDDGVDGEYIDSSCRNGVCTTCAAKIVEGRESVTLAVHGLEGNIGAMGYVCACQTYVTGPGVTIQCGTYDDVYELQYGQYEKSYQKTALTGKWDEKQQRYV